MSEPVVTATFDRSDADFLAAILTALGSGGRISPIGQRMAERLSVREPDMEGHLQSLAVALADARAGSTGSGI